MEPRLRQPEEIAVNFPFLIALEHPPLDIKGMFEFSLAFDMYEMQLQKDGQSLIKEIILVDVLEVTPTVSIIKVTPTEPLPYPELLKHVEPMIVEVSKRFGNKPMKILRLTWEIDQTGVASDLRGMLRKI